MGKRWRVGAIAAAVVLLLYAAFGFLAVPRLIQWQLPRIADEQLRAQGSVGDVRFNPFTLRLVADRFALRQPDGQPIAAIERLEAQGDWLSPFHRAWSLRALRIDAPDLQVTVDPSGRSNLSRLIEAWQARQPEKATKDHGTPRFTAENIEVTRGRITIDDRQAGFIDQITPIDLRLNRLSTLPQDVNGYQLSADIASGGRLRWRGEVSLNPVRAKGEVGLEALELRAADPYLRRMLRLAVRQGQLNGKLPFNVEMNGKQFQAQLLNAGLSIQGLQAALPDAKEPFATLKNLEISALSFDLAERALSVEAIRANGGQLQVRRDVEGEFDLTKLSLPAGSADGAPQQNAAAPWKLAIKQLQLEQIALRAVDAAAQPPATWQADVFGVSLQLDGHTGPRGAEATMRNVRLAAQGLSVAQGEARPIRLDRVELADGTADLRNRHLQIGRLSVNGGQVQLVRDEHGDIDLMRLAPASAPAQDDHAPDWKAQAHQITLAGLTVDVEDQSTGLRTQLQDVMLRAEEAGTDLSRPVRVEASLRLREGGQLALQGQASPATRGFLGDIRVHGLSVLMAQPVLQRYLRAKLASGTVDAQGRLESAVPAGKPPTVRFEGNAAVAGFRLNEMDGTPLVSWRTLSASRTRADMQGVTIPELTLVGSYFPLTIQPDRTLNTSRLLVPRPPASAPTAAPAHATAVKAERPASPFAVRIGALRLQGGRMNFTDQSLQPPFNAQIHDLNGTITGLHTRPDSRSQVALDGTVDEYGQARIRGALNLLALAQDTDVRVIFRNIDMVKQSPYAVRFAGYRIASGRMSLDLHYQVRDSQLLGDNKIVIDQLTLGERVESPEATKLPVALAISILKDPDGRIDLGLPVSGNLADPDFSYTALFLKALRGLVTKVVTAPFRNFGGGDGAQQFDAIDFDAGSSQLQPPEREKLAHAADVLNKRSEFKLTVPASYAQDADAVALRRQAVRQELARRTGVAPSAAQAQGPPNLNDRNVRSALRDMYAQRFGQPELDKARQAAQGSATSADGKAPQLNVFQQLGRAMQGEPQVQDTSAFYRNLLRRLEQEQTLPADALARLGQDRAQAIIASLTRAGVAQSRVAPSAPEAVAANDQRMVPVKLALDLR